MSTAAESYHTPPVATNAQHVFRRHKEYGDKHGRRWFAIADKRNGDPVFTPTPLFKAPWLPDAAFIKPDPRDDRRLWLDYEGMLADYEQAWAAYLAHAQQQATARGWDVPTDAETWQTWDPRLLAIIGCAPKSPVPIVAAMQGNRWILGLTSKVDARVAKHLPTPPAPRAVRALSQYGDFSDTEPENEAGDDGPLESLMDLDEIHDPDGIKTEKLSRGKRGATRQGRRPAAVSTSGAE